MSAKFHGMERTAGRMNPAFAFSSSPLWVPYPADWITAREPGAIAETAPTQASERKDCDG